MIPWEFNLLISLTSFDDFALLVFDNDSILKTEHINMAFTRLLVLRDRIGGMLERWVWLVGV